MNDSPLLILIRGLPGSGKSTLARALVRRLRQTLPAVSHLEVDQFLSLEQRRHGRARDQASQLCRDIAADQVLSGLSVILANCFVSAQSIEHYLGIVDPLYLVEAPAAWDVATCWLRVGRRGRQTGLSRADLEAMARSAFHPPADWHAPEVVQLKAEHIGSAPLAPNP